MHETMKLSGMSGKAKMGKVKKIPKMPMAKMGKAKHKKLGGDLLSKVGEHLGNWIQSALGFKRGKGKMC